LLQAMTVLLVASTTRAVTYEHTIPMVIWSSISSLKEDYP